MTEAEIRELIRAASGGRQLTPQEIEEVLKYMRNKMSPESVKEFEKYKNQQQFWKRLGKALFRKHSPWFRAIWLIPVYMALALIIDSNTDPYVIEAGQGPCAETATPVPLKASKTSYGPQSALKSAQEELARLCNASGINCSDPGCSTCAPDVFVSTSEISNYILVYTATITGDCRCWCK